MSVLNSTAIALAFRRMPMYEDSSLPLLSAYRQSTPRLAPFVVVSSDVYNSVLCYFFYKDNFPTWFVLSGWSKFGV